MGPIVGVTVVAAPLAVDDVGDGPGVTEGAALEVTDVLGDEPVPVAT